MQLQTDFVIPMPSEHEEWLLGLAAVLGWRAVGTLLLGLPDAVSAMVLASSFPLFCADLTLPSALLAGSWPTCPYEDISLTSQGGTVMGRRKLAS